MNPGKIFKNEFKKKNLLKIYNQNIKSKHSIGHDHITNDAFQKKIDEELTIIKRKVRNGTYNFTVYKEKLITKGAYRNPRVISIPTIRDKLVLKTIHNTLMNIYGNPLQHESAQRKIRKAKNAIGKNIFDSFIKIDIQNFFPTVDHKILLDKLSTIIQDKNLLHLISQAITQNTVAIPRKNAQKNTNQNGLPQGLSISGTLAEIYLLELDKIHADKTDYVYFRYVDDILILCKKENSESILNKIVQDITSLKLKAHKPQLGSEKTSYGSLKNQFTFLGHTFTNHQISVRDESIKKLEDSIVKLFTNYKYTQNKKYLYHKLNLRITGGFYNDKQFGWLYFFSNIDNMKLLFSLDHFVKKLFIKFNIPHEAQKIKKFSRTYYEIKKNNPSLSYIPNLGTYKYKQKKQLLNLSKSKKVSLNTLPKKVRIINIDKLFGIEIKKELLEIKKDIGVYY